MKEVKEIRIVFENLETCTINETELGFVFISDIKEEVSRIAINAITKMKVAKDVFIEITKDNNFGDDKESPATIFNRILYYNDITSLEIHYKDGTSDEVFTEYNEDEKFSNKNQHSQVEENNRLYVVISKDYKSFRDKFKDEFDDYINSTISTST